MLHRDFTAPGGVHQVTFVSSTDPAVDVNNRVAAHKLWIDTTTGFVLKKRNAGNTDWDTVSGGGSSLFTPDTPPGSPGDVDDEFNAGTLNGAWTEDLVGSSTRNTTTWTSHYYVASDGTANQRVRLWRAFTPGAGAFSLTAKFRCPAQDVNRFVALYASDSNATLFAGDVVHIQRAGASIVLNKIDAGGLTQIGNITAPTINTLHFHLQRDASNGWEGWFSTDALSWDKIASFSKTFTVGRLIMQFGNSTSGTRSRIGCDWVRRDWITL